MHEELFLSSETPAPTSRAGVLLATSEAVDLDELRRLISELADAARARRTTETFALIHRIVPTYGPPLDDSAAIGAAQ